MTTDYITFGELSSWMASDSATISDAHEALGEEAITTASRAIDTHCGQVFYNSDTSVSVYADWRCTTRGQHVLDLPYPMHTVSAVASDSGAGTYATSWSLTTDYLTLPRNGVVNGISGHPITGLRSTGTKSWTYSTVYEHMKVTGKIGWTAVPAQVKHAAKVLSAQLLKQKEATLGVADFGEFGGLSVPRQTMAQVAAILQPFNLVGGTGLGGFA